MLGLAIKEIIMTVTKGQNPATIRRSNIRLMLDTIRKEGQITIPELAQKVKLSKTTVWKTVDYFVQKQLVVNIGKAQSSEEGGKRPDLFQFNQEFGYVISIAIYGHYIACSLTNAQTEIFHQENISIPKNESLENVITIISTFISKWQIPSSRIHPEMKLLGIVLAISGVVDTIEGKSLTASRFAQWTPGAPVLQMLTERINLLGPVYIDNYNRFSAYAEKTIGGYSDFNDLLILIASEDGLGGGLMQGGSLQRGYNNLIGEIGHMRINVNDKEICHCGGQGCFEQQVSLERLINSVITLKSQYPESPLFSLESLEIQSIFDYANAGDPLSKMVIDDIVQWYAIGLHNAMMAFDPELILIGGTYRTAGPYFIEQLRTQIQKVSLTRMNKKIHIHYAHFGIEGVLIGGASYVLDTFFDNYAFS